MERERDMYAQMHKYMPVIDKGQYVLFYLSVRGSSHHKTPLVVLKLCSLVAMLLISDFAENECLCSL